MPRYVTFDGELVSYSWGVALENMRAAGVRFSVSEGHRTLARQKYFWDCMNCKCCNNGNLAAFPSPTAPHIRTGRNDHAIDFGGDLDGVMRWLANAGLSPTRPAGAGTPQWEPWHVEVSGSALRGYAKRNRPRLIDKLPRHLELAARRYRYHRHMVRDLQPEARRAPRKFRKRLLRHQRWLHFWQTRLERKMRKAKPKTRRIISRVLD